MTTVTAVLTGLIEAETYNSHMFMNGGTIKTRPQRIVLIAVFTLITIVGAACASSSDSEVASTSEPATTQPEAATAQPEPATAEPEPTDPSAEPTAAPAQSGELEGGELAPPSQTSMWTGVIDGNIGVSISLEQRGSRVGGEITYGAEPIRLLGRGLADGGYFLHEFGPDGRVSGTLNLPEVIDGEVFGATWGNLPLDLQFVSLGDAAGLFGPASVAGNYSYAFSPFGDTDTCCGPQGSLEISEVSDTEVTVEFNNTTSGPAFNMALIPPTRLQLEGNVTRFESVDDFIDCAFEIELFDGFVYVQYVDGRFECGFGNRAAVEAIYVLDQQP